MGLSGFNQPFPFLCIKLPSSHISAQCDTFRTAFVVAPRANTRFFRSAVRYADCLPRLVGAGGIISSFYCLHMHSWNPSQVHFYQHMDRHSAIIDASAYRIVSNEIEFDRYVAELLPYLLDRATTLTRRFLRETGRWENHVVNEKLALRWGYELLERFRSNGRCEVPCRPLHLFDSYVFWCYSQPDRFPKKAETSPVCRFLDALHSRAVHSRDAMIAIYYHLYGLNQQQVAGILALRSAESQRVYKNYMRWRSTGWSRMIEEVGLKQSELCQISEQKKRNPEHLHKEVEQHIRRLQSHYRKSEPAHYPCLTRSEWQDAYERDYRHDYKAWHLPLCRSCLTEVWGLRQLADKDNSEPKLNLHIHPFLNRSPSNLQGLSEPVTIG